MKAAIDADPALAAQPLNSDGAYAIKEVLNQTAAPDFIVWRTAVPVDEIMRNGMAEQEALLKVLPALSVDTGAPLVATSDVHYLTQDAARAHDVHVCISTGSSIDDTPPITPRKCSGSIRTAPGRWPLL